MKFDFWDGQQVQIDSLEIDPEPLQSRQCGKCKGTVFFSVYVSPALRRTQLPPSSFGRPSHFANHFAMCEGCKMIVEIL